MAEPCFAVLDFATGGGKCVIFDAAGRCVARVRRPWKFTPAPHEHDALTPGQSFDPATSWSLLAECAREALASAEEIHGIAAGDIAGISTTSLRLGTVLLDEQKREIYCGPNMDGRGFAGALSILESLDRSTVAGITGHWPPFLSSAARLVAYRDMDGASDPAWALSLSDWLAFRLSGTLAAEPSNSGETFFLDIRTRNWSREMLAACGSGPALLPQLVEPGTRIGEVTPEATAATGFATGTPVFAGGADSQCALLAAGAVDHAHGAIILGTTAPVMVAADHACIEPDGALWAGCHVLEDRWTLESNAGETGRGWEWLLDLFGFEGEEGFQRLEEELLAAERTMPETGEEIVFAFAQPQVFDLDHYNPARMLGFGFRPRPVSGSAGPTRGELLLAYLRNLGFALRANLERLDPHFSGGVRSVTLAGGMSRSAAVQRQLARLLPAPVTVTAEADASPLGAAILASVGSGVHSDVTSALESMTSTRPVEVDPTFKPGDDAAYAKWRELYSVSMQTSI